MRTFSTEKLLLLFFVLAKFFLQYHLIHPIYELQRDEYLHLDQANHLALGYASIPPLTSWLSLLIKVLGNGVFWIKFFPALFGALTLIVVWKLVDALNGGLDAKVLAALGVLFSALLRMNTLYQPNSFDVLSWTAVMYFLVRYSHTFKSKYLYLTAVGLAIGFLNKYNIVFLMLGLVPALLISSQRKIFAEKHLYLAGLLALILVLPNLYWQFSHDFPVMRHMQTLAETQLVNVPRGLFLKNQLIFYAGSLAVIGAGLYALVFDAEFKALRFLFWNFVFVLAIFTYLRAKDYYAMGLYPIYIGLGSVFLMRLLSGWWGKALKVVLMLGPLLFFAGMYNLAFPNRSPDYIIEHKERYQAMGMLRWEDGRDHEIPQDYADMLGWKELAEKVDKAYHTLRSSGPTLVVCDNYGQAGAINYYSQLGVQAVSFDADYLNWFDLRPEYKNLIRVKYAWEVSDEMEETATFFERAKNGGSIENQYAREQGTTVLVFQGVKIDMNQRILEELEENGAKPEKH